MMERYKATSGYGAVGLEFVVSIVVCMMAGHWLDGRFGSGPWLTLAGIVLGMSVGGRFLWVATRRMQKETENDGFRPNDIGRDPRFAPLRRRRP